MIKFIHRHKKTVSKKTQDKIIRNELTEHCISEPISHFHPAQYKTPINCLPVIRRAARPKKNFQNLDELSMEEGVRTKQSSSFHNASGLSSLVVTSELISVREKHNSFSTGATPDDRLHATGKFIYSYTLVYLIEIVLLHLGIHFCI